MNTLLKAPKRPQTRGEETANSVSHGVGLLAALLGTPVLMASAIRRGGTADVIGAGVFAFTMALLYLTSTLYHAHPGPAAKGVLRVIDHGAIFLLIAGTYTPFTLGVLRGPWGWTLFGLIWGLAVAGILLKSIGRMPHPVLTTALYLAMGWLIVIAAKPVLLTLPRGGVVWLLAGGVAYTAGVGLFAARQIRYAHFLWHLFVMAGTACHYVAVLNYAIG